MRADKDIVPKLLSKPTIALIPETGLSSMTYEYVRDQHYEVKPSMPTMEAGDQQSEVYMQLLQLKTTLRPFRDWRQQFAPQNQEAGFVPWAPQPQQNTYDCLRAVSCAP
ncbi:hypothetical protein ACET3Z_009815 [Daucus carota]